MAADPHTLIVWATDILGGSRMSEPAVLFAGGTGTVGRRALRWFRVRHPDVPVLVGGRTIGSASQTAREVRAARAVSIDLTRRDLGLSAGDEISAVVMLAPDDGLNGLMLAQSNSVPYLNIGNGLVELGPEVSWFAHRPQASAVVLASHWLGGAATFLALHTAKSLEAVTSIRIGALFDERDAAGPLAMQDMQRLQQDGQAALVFQDGHRHWVSEAEVSGGFTTIDGRRIAAEAYAPLDVISLHAATGAPDIRFDLAAGESSSRRRGSQAAAEIVVDVTGTTTIHGRRTVQRRRSTLEFGAGQASLTGLCVILSLEAAMGLSRPTAAEPGLYLPELLSTPQDILLELTKAGADIHHTGH